MNKITRILAIVMAIIMAFGLTACGGETAPETTNAPTEAPTTEPVNICETEGHAWMDATCEAPKSCSVCGETEGEALGHVWIDATYQAPKTCETCDATEGEALVGYFAEHGLDARLLDKTAEHTLPFPCYDDNSKTTIAKVTIENYKTIASDETHEAKDGYEWKTMTIKLHFSDENAVKYGVNTPYYMWLDKYEVGVSDGEIDGDLFGDGVLMNYVWNGVEYTDGLLRIEDSITDWLKDDGGNSYRDFVAIISVRVPVGYDGFVFGLETTTWSWPADTYLHDIITDDTLLFCMD